MRLCSYTVVHDTGFAPNPFGGYCTLAACTPNHQGVRLCRGDWVLGHSTAGTGHKLIYAMKISEVLGFDEYSLDERFASKKPRLDRGWELACGDNIYYRGDDGAWKQRPTRFHENAASFAQDVKHPRVFVSEHFFYFGASAPDIPDEYRDLVRERQGVKCRHARPLVVAFTTWLESSFTPGKLGIPRDLDWVRELPSAAKSMTCGAERTVPPCAPPSVARSGCTVAEVHARGSCPGRGDTVARRDAQSC
jgi:hypothetical protein